ncbi:MAG: energy transducer TonB [Bacteroidia bacterium]|nr:energy transducer TonB [Bacteroidia bacterium]
MKKFLVLITFLGIAYTGFSQINQQVVVNQEAQFPGGDQALVQYIYQNIKWPDATKGNLIMDEMTISLDVLPDSSIANVVVLKKVGFGIDEVVVDMIKKKKFIPSIQNGVAVKMNVMLGVPIQVRN